ncbi:UDP-2,4-diacetamido-2,4,6-trideoxy-beta-L-altropyranose hydrolase [Ferrovibrio sp.]|uniref:UDP-2,4-diacetamido-2,4, 6-trideoxy-beta-L-altropyranose hydrolase n=1 Tax=Ferrovibrio sp. TaxID=1917215 RepID=UPI0035B34815
MGEAKRQALFRVDAGQGIGAGHLIRCQALAQALESQGWRIHLAGAPEGFAMLPLPSWPRIPLQGLDAEAEATALAAALPEGVDLLVVDHYGRDAAFERACRPWARHILVIDDLADRPHDCDWLLDATPFRMAESYAGLVPAGSGLLLGGEHALLRPGFSHARWRRETINDAVQTLLVSLGATDPGRYLPMVLQAIADSGYDRRVLAMLAPSAPHYADVMLQLEAMGGAILAPDADAAAALAGCDLAIGAGGVGLLERACLGLPSLLLGVADNQRDNLAAVAAMGAAIVLPDLQPKAISRNLRRLLDDGRLCAELSRRNALLCDGLGVWRVLLALQGGDLHLRRALPTDSTRLLAWQTDPATRRFARDANPPDPAKHEAWYSAKLADPLCLFHIVEQKGLPVGMLRLDWRKERQGFEVSIAIDPAQHGNGLGAAALHLARLLVPQENLWAYVKPENAPSLRVFAKAGYVASKEADWYFSQGRAVR